MTTAAFVIDIAAIIMGYWQVGIHVTVNGMTPDDIASTAWAELADTGGAIIKHTTACDINGNIAWDGAIAGSSSNSNPRLVTVFAHYRAPSDIEYKKNVDLALGYDTWSIVRTWGIAGVSSKGVATPNNKLYAELSPIAKEYLVKRSLLKIQH